MAQKMPPTEYRRHHYYFSVCFRVIVSKGLFFISINIIYGAIDFIRVLDTLVHFDEYTAFYSSIQLITLVYDLITQNAKF